MNSQKINALIFIFLCCESALSLANNEIVILPSEQIPERGNGCFSLVCENTDKRESVNPTSDIPTLHNKDMLSAIGSTLFILGEIGLAENLQEEKPEPSVFD